MTTLIRRKRDGQYVATFDHFDGYPERNCSRHITTTKDPAKALRATDEEARLLVDIDMFGNPYGDPWAHRKPFSESRIVYEPEFERVDLLEGTMDNAPALREDFA
jgi:hypothetical protein